jgi:hypothetical protein
MCSAPRQQWRQPMRTDPLGLATGDLEALAAEYGISLGLKLLGVGQVERVNDALMMLGDVVGADNTQTALERGVRSFLIEDAITHLTLQR